MAAWGSLAAAVAFEVTASLSLAEALARPGFYVIVAVGYVLAFALLGRALASGIPLGVAYGTWGALGVTLTALGSAVLFGERMTPTAIIGIGLVVTGVLLVESGHAASHPSEPGS